MTQRQILSASEKQLYHLDQLIDGLKHTGLINKENIITKILNIVSVTKSLSPESNSFTDVKINIAVGYDLITFLIYYSQLIHEAVLNIILLIRDRTKRLIDNIKRETPDITMSEINLIVVFNIEQLNPIGDSRKRLQDRITSTEIDGQFSNLNNAIGLLLENIRPYNISIRFSTTSVTLEDHLLAYIFIHGLDKGLKQLEIGYIQSLSISFSNYNEFNYHDHTRVRFILKALYNYIINSSESPIINNVILDLNHDSRITFNTDELYQILNIINIIDYKYNVFYNTIVLDNQDSSYIKFLQEKQANLISHGMSPVGIPSSSSIIFQFDHMYLDFSDTVLNPSNIVDFIKSIQTNNNLRYLFLPRINLQNIENINISYVYDIYTLILLLITRTLDLSLSINDIESMSDSQFDDMMKDYLDHQRYFLGTRLFDMKESIHFDRTKTGNHPQMNEISFQKNIKLHASNKNTKLVWNTSRQTSERDIDSIKSLIYHNTLRNFAMTYVFVIELGLDLDKKVSKTISSVNRIKTVLQSYISNDELFMGKALDIQTNHSKDKDGYNLYVFEFL